MSEPSGWKCNGLWHTGQPRQYRDNIDTSTRRATFLFTKSFIFYEAKTLGQSLRIASAGRGVLQLLGVVAIASMKTRDGSWFCVS